MARHPLLLLLAAITSSHACEISGTNVLVDATGAVKLIHNTTTLPTLTDNVLLKCVRPRPKSR